MNSVENNKCLNEMILCRLGSILFRYLLDLFRYLLAA